MIIQAKTLKDQVENYRLRQTCLYHPDVLKETNPRPPKKAHCFYSPKPVSGTKH